MLNCFSLVDAKSALAAARASEARWRKGAPHGPARRRAGLDQGPPPHQGLADAARLEDRRSRRARGTTTRRRWRACARRGAVLARQDDDARVRLEGRHRQPAHRHHAQSLEPGEDARRLLAAAAPRRSPPAWARSPSAPTAAARSASPAASPACSASSRRFGRVPAWPLSPFGTVAHLGPMTRTRGRRGADAERARAARRARLARAALRQRATTCTGLEDGVKGLRIAYSPDLGYAKVDPEIAALVKQAVEASSRTSARTSSEVDPGFDDQLEVFTLHWFPGAAYVVRNIPAGQAQAHGHGPAGSRARRARRSPCSNTRTR